MPIYPLVDIVTVLFEEKSSRNIVSKGNEKVWMQKVVENSRIRINSILNKNKGDREAKQSNLAIWYLLFPQVQS
jgi:hypothetical protein